MTDREALELSLTMLERDTLKVGNIYINYDIQKALIKLVKKKLEKKKKKEWVGLTENDIYKISEKCGLMDAAWEDVMNAVEATLKDKNT